MGFLGGGANAHELGLCGAREWGSASPWLHAVLDAPPRPLRRLGGRAGSYAYFSVAGSRRIVALEGPGGLDLPISIIVRGRIITDALRSCRVFIGDGQLFTDFGALQVKVSRDDRLHLNITAGRAGMAAQSMMSELAAIDRPKEARRVHDAVAAFGAALCGDDSSIRLETAAHDLIGLGLGSTPSGDDLIAGTAATLASIAGSASALSIECRRTLGTLKSVIHRSRNRTTALSTELLSCAVHGHAMWRFRRYATCAVSDADISRATLEMCGTGHTSGYFLANGAALALKAVSTLREPGTYHD